MPSQRPTYSDVEEIGTNGNYGIDESGVDMVVVQGVVMGSIKSIEEILAQHLEAAREVLAANHAKAVAGVRMEVMKLRQDNQKMREELHGLTSNNGMTSEMTSRVGSAQQQDFDSNAGDNGYFSSSRGQWVTSETLTNSPFAKLDIRRNIANSNPPGTVAFGNSDSFETVASNSRGFSAKKGRGRGTPFDLASVPVPLSWRSRQPPNLVVPANRKAMASTPPTTPAHLQDIAEVRASESPLRHLQSMQGMELPPGTPAGIPATMEAVPEALGITDIDEDEELAGLRPNSQPIGDDNLAGLRRLDTRSSEATQLTTLDSRPASSPSVQDHAQDSGWHAAEARERGTRIQTTWKSRMSMYPQANSVQVTGAAKEERSGTMRPSQMDLATNPKTVFADAELMKEKVRAAIGKPEYNVVQYYKSKGMCQRIARSPIFENITLFVIALNALWIGYDTDENDATTLADADVGFQVAEHAFCAYFFLEWMVRFGAFSRKFNVFHDSWFMFDSVLVLLMVIETWIMYATLKIMSTSTSSSTAATSDRLGDASVLRLLRLLRLTRMARMVRLLRAMPELMILVKGMFVATRSVFFTLCLLMVIIYVFGIAFTQLTVDTPVGRQYFNNIFDSMNTLLLYGTLLEDTPDVVNAVGNESIALRFLFLLFILLASLTVMNMLVGVLVEVVSVVSSVEKEQLQVNFVKARLFQMIEQLDANRDGMISKFEFEQLLSNPEAARALRDVGVDVVGLVDFHDFLFHEDGKDLTFANFMEIVLSLRGTNQATVKDIVDLRKFLISELGRMTLAIQEHLIAMLTTWQTTSHGHRAAIVEDEKNVPLISSSERSS